MVYHYYMHYLGKYKDPMIGKMEELPNSLINILKGQTMRTLMKKELEKTFMYTASNNRTTNTPVSLIDSMNYERCKKLITKAEKKLCKEFD